MKHLLNNLSEEEKNKIREQHTGGMKVDTKNFTKLLKSKLGNSKPITEQSEINIDPKDLELPNEDMLRKIFTGEEDFTKHFGKSPEEFKKVMQACISERDLYKVESLVNSSETKKMDVLKTIMAMVMDRGLGGRTLFQEFNELGKCVNEKLSGKLDDMMK